MATASNAFFVSENWIKDNTPITQNVDVKEIYPFINVAQDMYFKKKLTTPLYNRLKQAIINTVTSQPNGLNPDEIILLDYIKPALSYYITYEALPSLNDKIRNIGIVETADNKQRNVESQGRKELRNEILNKAQYYTQELNEYLCDNSDLYPEFDRSCGCCGKSNEGNLSNAYDDFDMFIDPYCINSDWIKKYYL